MTAGAVVDQRHEADSGWIGPNPQGWPMVRLRWLADLYAGGTPDRSEERYWEDGDIPWLNSGSVNQRLITEPSARITEDGFRHSSARWVPKDALVIALAGQGRTKGTVAQLAIDATCNQSMAAIVPQAGIDPRFLLWWLTANYETIRNLAGGELRDGLNLETVGNILCPVPPLSEQQAVAGYLDRETARIDGLVDKKLRMAALLEERAHVAFLDCLARRGFEWPAELEPDWSACDLPAAWQVVRLSQTLTQLTNGYVGPTRDILRDEGIRYIQSLHIKGGRIDFSRGAFFVDPAWHMARPRVHLRQGDVLIVQTGDIGQVAVVPPGFGEASCHALQIARVRKDVLTGPYLAAYLRSPFGYHSLLSRATGALHPHLEAGIRDIPIVVPPLAVQGEVVSEMDHIARVVGRAITALEDQIGLLRDRRRATITAAVTQDPDLRRP